MKITKAYRKKALKCHPDKNPDNPNAAQLFHNLNKAFEILGNPKAKEAYDAKLKAKERVKLRNQAYDSKRKKFKEDLERKEKTSQEDFFKEEILVKNLEQEIERLREEGMKILENEQKLMKEQIEKEREQKERSTDNTFEISTPKLKLKWKSEGLETNGGYSQELLYSRFQKYGEIENLLVSQKRKGTAIIEFKNYKDAEMAVVNEMGILSNPLQISWLTGHYASNTGQLSEATSGANDNDLSSNRDFESLVMRKLRQAEERKRLCEEIAKEDAEEK